MTPSTNKLAAAPSLDFHRVALLEHDGPEVVFASDSAHDVITWAREWLRDPIGLAIALYPPGVPMEGGGT